MVVVGNGWVDATRQKNSSACCWTEVPRYTGGRAGAQRMGHERLVLQMAVYQLD
jgi:hypothetical protein